MNAPPRYPQAHPHSHSLSRSFPESQQQQQQQQQPQTSRAGPPPLPHNLYYNTLKYEEPSPPDTIGSSSYTIDHFEIPPPKRKRFSGPGIVHTAASSGFPRSAIASPPDSANALKAIQVEAGRRPSTGEPPTPTTAVPAGTAGKSKRVRTGCLTCRDRHLKCDEGLPDCNNCRKSNRSCKRGIRANFIDIDCRGGPNRYDPPGPVQWQDDSRLIASEYQGGLARFAAYDRVVGPPLREGKVEAAVRQQTDQQYQHQHRQQQQQQQPEPQLSELPHPYGQYDMGSRDLNRPASYGTYYQHHNLARPAQPEYSTFDDTQSQRDMLSRRSSDAYGPISRQQQQQPQIMQLQPMQQQQQTHHQQQSAYYSGQFSLAALQEQSSTRDDGTRHSHSYKSSDMSSVTSSLVPQHAGPASQSFRLPCQPGQQPSGPQDGTITPPSEKTTGEKDYLNQEDEIYYIQVFINEVAIWMDSLDHQKHFSRVVPFLALKSVMLLNAVLSCGVKHLELTRGITPASANTNKVLQYYDTATTLLLRSLQNPDRNMAECATTAVVLNVYEIMSEKPAARMSHIAGARALIRECGWDAKSTGIASACFWLNVGMEILSCLAFNWQTAWEPDQWGLDVNYMTHPSTANSSLDGEGRGMLDHEINGAGNTGHERHVRNAYNLGGGGEEEAWVHRIFYVVAKIANFRANIPRFQEPSPHDEQVRLQSRFAEWKRLKAMCDTWNNNCPTPMRPFGYAPRSSKSLFPNIMFVRRAATVGRLFYHTAMCLLAQINPLEPSSSEENRAAQLHHAHQVCGIIAHTKDHGVSSVAIRSLAIAACVLIVQEEQAEVIAILTRINQDTGWKLGNVVNELQKAWGWGNEGNTGGVTKLASLGPPPGQQSGGYQQQQQQQQGMMPMPTRPVNPLLAKADFSRPDHPYLNWYRPPNGQNAGGGGEGFWGTCIGDDWEQGAGGS